MQERKKMQFYSVVSLLGVFELCTAQDVVIGLDSARKTVNEQSENFTICANVLSSISSSYSINVSVIYQDRSAVGKTCCNKLMCVSETFLPGGVEDNGGGGGGGGGETTLWPINTL